MGIPPNFHTHTSSNSSASIYGHGRNAISDSDTYKNLKLKNDAQFKSVKSRVDEFKPVQGEIVDEAKQNRIKDSAYRNHLFARINDANNDIVRKREQERRKDYKQKYFNDEWLDQSAQKAKSPGIKDSKKPEANNETLEQRISKLEDRIVSLEDQIISNINDVKAQKPLPATTAKPQKATIFAEPNPDSKYQSHNKAYSSMIKDLSNMKNHISFS